MFGTTLVFFGGGGGVVWGGGGQWGGLAFFFLYFPLVFGLRKSMFYNSFRLFLTIST